MARKTAIKPKKIVRGLDVPYANQYLLDPRQKLCWDFYVNPKSSTFSNALQSAIRAGYSEITARHITKEQWWHDRARRLGLLSKAERNLEDALDLPTQTQAMGAFGPLFEKKVVKEKVKLKNGKTKIKTKVTTGKPIMTFNIGLLNVRTNAAQFVAERIGKARYGKKDGEGGDTFNINIFGNEQLRRIAERALRDRVDGSTVVEGTSD